MITATTINIGGDSRTAEDKIGLRVRKRMIDSGQLIPSRPLIQRPIMSIEAVARTKAALIRAGIIVPGGTPVEPYSLKKLLEARPRRLCRKCGDSQWLCPCGVLE